MATHPVSGSDEAVRIAADLLLAKARVLGDRGRRLVWGLCGGRSVAAVYARLAASDFDFSTSHFFALDERCVPRTSPDWNFAIIEDHLTKPLLAAGRIKAEQVHPFEAGVRTAEEYGAELDACGGQFDLAVFSAGEDGHVAALFPRHPSMDDGAPGFIQFADSPKPPPVRMSAGRRLILKTRYGLLLVLGEGKQNAYERIFRTELTLVDVPAKMVLGLVDNDLVTDRRPVFP